MPYLHRFGLWLICVSALLSATPALVSVKKLCRDYATGFVSPATGLAYGKRINGTKGTSALSSLEDVRQRRVRGEVRPFGYGSGLEDTAYQNGMFLYALLDAHQATKDPQLAAAARQAFVALRKMSTLSNVDGFVPRGPHPEDAKTYYPDSSLDQHSLYLCAIWRYANSPLASADEKSWTRAMAAKILRRLETHNWSFVVEDGSAPSQAGGSMLEQRPTTSALLLVMLAIAHDLTQDTHWKQAYDKFSAENSGKRWKGLDGEIDQTRVARWNLFNNQDALRTETLRRIESTAERKAILQRRLARMAGDMLSAPYFQAWRRSWVSSEPWYPASDEAADAYLKPFGVTIRSKDTVMDLFRRFDGNQISPETLPGMNNRYEPIALATPAMVWQIAFLSGDPKLVKVAQAGVADMLARIDFNKVDLGWAYNYCVTASLWSLAAQP